MQSSQLSSLLIILEMFIIIATSSPELPNSTEVEKTCSVIACGTPGANGLPGRDGRDGREGSKGEKGDSGLQGTRGLQGPPGKAGPLGLKGDKGSLGEKGEKGNSGGNDLYDLKQLYNALDDQLQTLQESFTKYRKAFLFLIGKEVGRNIYVTDGMEYDYESAKQLCSKAEATLASPKNAEENLALQGLVYKHDKLAFLGIDDQETEGIFRHLTGEIITYTNWSQDEPNDKGNEDCVELISTGQWNDVSCAIKRLAICEF